MLLFIGDVDRGMKDREGFQEVDFGAMFAPLAKLVLRIDDPARIPEYVARAWNVALAGRPGPVVIALPEDMLLEAVTGVEPRPPGARPAQAVCPDAMGVLIEMIEAAASPVAIVGGAGWHAKAREHFTNFAERVGLPVAGAFRRQDAISNASPVWAGNLGYGPNPKLVERIKQADLVIAIGARLGEATTDGYTLITPDHPGQLLVHIHPDPNELGRVYRPDLAICADMAEFAEAADLWDDDLVSFDAGQEAHLEWLDWTTAKPAPYPLDMAACVCAMRDALPGDSIICNGAGNFSGWWHRYWHYDGFPTQLAPTAGAMGYGVPAAVAAALRHPELTVVALAGDGDFLMNGQELATAVQYGCDLLVVLVDNSAYGTIRMHQEREFPERVSGTTLHNPDFAALAVAYGGWAAKVETTEQFSEALAEAQQRKGLRLLHLVIDVEQLSAGGATISGLRARAK